MLVYPWFVPLFHRNEWSPPYPEMAFHSPSKAELIRSFLGPRTRGVSEEQLQIARHCIENRESITYERVDFRAILEDNNVSKQL